jgi:GAF domain-containing protein
MTMRHSAATRYATSAALIGLFFAVFSTTVTVSALAIPLTLENFIEVQRNTPRLWILGISPFVLGLLGLLAGKRQDQLTDFNRTLEDQAHRSAREVNQLQTLQENSEKRMSRRTVVLEAAVRRQAETNQALQEALQSSQRRADLLQAHVQISHSIARVNDLDELLPRISKLVSLHLGHHHTGIFLLDERSRSAVLCAASSPGGQRMLAQRYRLTVGSEGIIGDVSASGKSRVVLDVGADAAFLDYPDLPETRSEIAIPLRRGEEVIGVLDVHSAKPAAFTDDDVKVLEALADQIASAIEGARLYQESQQAMQEAKRAQQRYVQDQWSSLIREDAPSDNGQSIRSGLRVPITVRDEIIGILEFPDTDECHVWHEDEIALVQDVADQLGQAVDSARLFERTQSSLAETQTLFQTTRRLAAAQHAEDVWAAVIDAACKRNVNACSLFVLDTGQPETARELVVASGWDEQPSPRLNVGDRISLEDSGIVLDPDQVDPITLIARTSAGGTEPAMEFMSGLGFSAALVHPIVVRGRWFGLLAIFHESSHTFADAEIGFYRTLADQAALALEGQRLLAETQYRAQRERFIRQITDKVRSTTDLEDILEITVQELSEAMGLPRAFVRLGTSYDTTSMSSTP